GGTYTLPVPVISDFRQWPASGTQTNHQVVCPPSTEVDDSTMVAGQSVDFQRGASMFDQVYDDSDCACNVNPDGWTIPAQWPALTEVGAPAGGSITFQTSATQTSSAPPAFREITGGTATWSMDESVVWTPSAVADAGGPYTTMRGTAVTLNGSKSTG